MRKRLMHPVPDTSVPDEQWLDLESIAEVELTSEDPSSPIESALAPGQPGTGWRAAGPGDQTIRLVFFQPQGIRRIYLRFTERDVERTQEFVLRWSPDRGHSFRDIVRQQWNFSPGGATTEAEDVRVLLEGVTILELRIIPDIAPTAAVAGLEALRIA